GRDVQRILRYVGRVVRFAGRGYVPDDTFLADADTNGVGDLGVIAPMRGQIEPVVAARRQDDAADLVPEQLLHLGQNLIQDRRQVHRPQQTFRHVDERVKGL